jgi:hypothetical protein
MYNNMAWHVCIANNVCMAIIMYSYLYVYNNQYVCIMYVCMYNMYMYNNMYSFMA